MSKGNKAPQPVTAYVVPVNLNIDGSYYPAGITFSDASRNFPTSLNYLGSIYTPLAMVAQALKMTLQWDTSSPTCTLYRYAPPSCEHKADAIIALGKQYLGTPYRFGARAGQTRNFDCSSYTQLVYGNNGISLPRNSRQQSTMGIEVCKVSLHKGDLVYFWAQKLGVGIIGHVAIYLGEGQLLHAIDVEGVSFDSLSNPKWETQYMTSRRVILP
ncbi:MAG: C40 family peptidase [Bacillota bacterium]|nr:C40 family peptidase [Bacillota bacterium]